MVTIQITQERAYGVLNRLLPWDIDGRLDTAKKLFI
jgi:hypothetical protein